MKEKIRSFFVFVLALQVLLMFGQMEGFVILRRIDKATQSNAATLVEHSVKIAKHDVQLDKLLDGLFSKEFSLDIKRNLNHASR